MLSEHGRAEEYLERPGSMDELSLESEGEEEQRADEITNETVLLGFP